MKAKKRFGQNFLHNKNTLKFIANRVKEYGAKNILEIGGGTGNLTKFLLEIPNINLKIVEIDRELIPILLELTNEDAEIIESNILDYPINYADNIVVVGNLPYYITKPILMHIYKYKNYIDRAILMVQYEVAQNFTASPSTKQYNAFTVFLNSFAEVKFLKKVKKGEFSPAPNVDSALVELKIDKKHDDVYEADGFVDFIFSIFRERRKTVVNNLSRSYEKEFVINILKKCDIPVNIRAEALSLPDFVCIHKKLHN